jgi:hypothetical protein
MRGFGLLASAIVLAGLAACAERGPEYSYAPAYGYGAWSEGYYCCGPEFDGFDHFREVHDHRGFGLHSDLHDGLHDGFHSGIHDGVNGGSHGGHRG